MTLRHQESGLFYCMATVSSVFVLLLATTPVTVTAFNSSDTLILSHIQDAFCTVARRCTPIPNVYSNYVFLQLPVFPPYEPNERCCGPCSCNRTTCMVEGTCCPDILDKLPTKDESISAVQVTCEYPHLQYGRFMVTPRAGDAYKMYRKCPIEYTRHAGADKMAAGLVVSKCERSGEFNDIESKIPVTARETLKTYQNIYCAYCHGLSDSEFTPWKANVKCGPDSSIFPTDIDTLVSDILSTLECNIIYSPPSLPGLDSSRCDHTSKNTCNITGEWETYDPVIEAGCHAYTSVFKYYYRNVFCYLCNRRYTGDPFNARSCSAPYHPPVRVAFSFLLKLNSDKEEANQLTSKNETCTSAQMFDSYTETCRDLSCRRPWTLVDKKCVSILDNMVGVVYELFVKLEPLETSNDFNIDRDRFFLQHHVTDMFQEFNVSTNLYGFAIYKGDLTENRPSTDMSLHNYFVVHILVLSTTVHPLNSSVVNDLLSLHKSQVFVQTDPGLTQTYAATLGVRSSLFDANGTIMLEPVINYNRRISNPNGVSVTLSPLNKCPIFPLSVDEFNITITPTGIYSAVLNASWSHDDYSIDNGQIYICMDAYTAAIIAHQKDKDDLITSDNNVVVTWKGVLSFSCTCISILCAFLALLTYSLFKPLRTQPGINNMGLLISLIIAQLLFMFGVGQVLDTASVLCKVIGILVHFTWLLVTFWMNVCSFHVFRVFRSNAKCDSATLSTTAGYCMYCVMGSSILVIINVLVSLIKSGFTAGDIGYGGTDCYISTTEMVIYVFAIPVGVLVSMNIAFFVVVVVKLARSRSVVDDSHVQARRNYLKIYAKLSSLTGTTWLFGILYSFTNEEVFEYVFIILTAGHGLFIFVSFLCNDRVWQMYKGIISKYLILHSKSTDTNLSSMKPTRNQAQDSSKYLNMDMSARKPTPNQQTNNRKRSEQTEETDVSS